MVLFVIHCPFWLFFTRFLATQGLGLIFSSTLLEPKTVLPAKFHRNRPSCFPSTAGRTEKVAINDALPLKATRRDINGNWKSFGVAQHQRRYWPYSPTTTKLTSVANLSEKNRYFWPSFSREPPIFQHFLSPRLVLTSGKAWLTRVWWLP